MGKSTFSALEDLKTAQSKSDISALKVRHHHRRSHQTDRREPGTCRIRQCQFGQHRLRREDLGRQRPEEGITTFTDRGIEYLHELLDDIRMWKGGILGFLRTEKCELDVIERIMADEKNR
ncbi:hypothetical protein [Pontitalea aquivivens]|uniref:hypothetical protein n=1 Tax=Pontitalea aquivivens TaxID=3388663 RepID=UPI0039708AA3